MAKKQKNARVISIPAIEFRQGADRRLYSFAIDGKLLHSFCTVSRVSRQGSETLSGYQRPEVAAHISQIRDYLESESPILPNAIVVAFDGTVRFRAHHFQSNAKCDPPMRQILDDVWWPYCAGVANQYEYLPTNGRDVAQRPKHGPPKKLLRQFDG